MIPQEEGNHRMARFDGHVAIVTGGASGIGRATWQRLADEGAIVVATDIADRCEGLDELGARGLFVQHDVRSREQWQTLVETVRARWGRLDILVNSAGILREGTVEDTDYETWRQVMAVNVDGTFWGCQAAIPLMNDSGGGAIVNVSSVSGLKGDAELAAYDASKGAVRLLSKEVALFCAARNYPVRCNSVHPGVVETPMVNTFLETMKLSDAADWTQPIGRLIRPAEVAGMIAWLSSSAASLVTGSEFTIDGGATA